jgi:hypothetical protein
MTVAMWIPVVLTTMAIVWLERRMRDAGQAIKAAHHATRLLQHQQALCEDAKQRLLETMEAKQAENERLHEQLEFVRRTRRMLQALAVGEMPSKEDVHRVFKEALTGPNSWEENA